MNLASTFMFVVVLVLGCRSVDLNKDDPDLQKFFDSLNPVKKVGIKKIGIKKDSKSILKEYLSAKKDIKQTQKLEAEDALKLKLKTREKLPLTTSGKNVVGLMQQVEKIIKKSIKVSVKTVPINIDFNAIDYGPIANVKHDKKKNEDLPKRSGGNYNSAPSGSGFNAAPSGSGYNTAPSGNGGYNTAPSGGGGYNTAPSGGGGYNTAPSGGGGYNTAPSGGGGYNTAPSGGGGYNTAPSGGGGYNTAPSGSGGYNTTPSGGGGYNTAPSGSGYNAAPMSSYPSTGYGSNYYQQQSYRPYGTSYDKDEKEPIIIDHKPLKFAPKEHQKKKHKVKSLDLHDYKSIWLQMIFNVYKLMENKYNVKGDDMNYKTMKLLFKVLKGTSILPWKKKKHVCPYSYDTAGSLCLSAEYLQERLTYEESRLYCQQIKGGDLVIIRNACEFKEVVEYLEEIDPYKSRNYWIGANDVYYEGHWTNVDGSIFPLGPPFWGKVLGVMEPSGSDPVIPGKEDYGMMMAADFFYVHDVSNNQGTTLHGIPLCQYVHQRDRYQKTSEKPKGWGPYAAYNEWKKHKQNNIFDNYFGYDNQHVKPENPFEEYGHFNYKPPEEEFSSAEYQISPYVKPPEEDNNPYEGEGTYEQNYYKPPEYEYKPIISEASYVKPPEEDNDFYGSTGPIQGQYVNPPDEGYNNYIGEKPYQELPETYPIKEQIAYKPTKEGYNSGYDQAHIENEYLENISNGFEDHDSDCSDCNYGVPGNTYQGPFYPDNNQITSNQPNYGNPISYPSQHGSYNNGGYDPHHQQNTNQSPVYGNQSPDYGNQSPVYGQVPVYGNQSPLYGNQAPVYDNQSPVYGNQVPVYGKEAPVYGSHVPVYGNQVPVYGNQSPLYGNQVPVYGNQVPVYDNQSPVYGNQDPVYSYEKANTHLDANKENYKITGNTTINVDNPQYFNDLSQVYNSQIQPSLNFPIHNIVGLSMKDNTPISHIQYYESNLNSSLPIPISHFSDQQIVSNEMQKESVTSLDPNNPFTTILIPNHPSKSNVNYGMVSPNSNIYHLTRDSYNGGHVSTALIHNIPQISQINSVPIIPVEQNSQMNHVQIIPDEQNPSYIHPIANVHFDKSPSSIALISPNSYPAVPTQVNHLGSPQILQNNYNQNSDFYSQPNHNPVIPIQQPPGTLYNVPSQGSREHIFVIQGNSPHTQIHQGLQPQDPSGSLSPEQKYIGSNQLNHNVPALHDHMKDNVNNQPQNVPFIFGSTSPSEQRPLQPQIYVISNTHLPNDNLPQFHPQQVHNSGIHYGGPAISSPGQIVHVSDLRSPAFSQDLFMVNNQQPQNSLSIAPNYQTVALLNQPSSTTAFHPSTYSTPNKETRLVISEGLSSHYPPINGVSVEKHYRNELNFPERFSEARNDEKILLDDSSMQTNTNSTLNV